MSITDNAKKYTYHIFKSSIIIHVNDKTLVISKDDPRYETLYNAIYKNDVSALENVSGSEAANELKSLLLFE